MASDWRKQSRGPTPARGRDGRFVADSASSRSGRASSPAQDGPKIVQRRHVDWIEHQMHWRWLLDSLEGGDRYRNAVYGPDRRGLPCRNLFRHKREYPDPQMFPGLQPDSAGAVAGAVSLQASVWGPFPGMLGSGPGATAQDDDYEYRRARTPVPEFVAEALEIHLAKIYEQEVARDGPDDLKSFWRDVDGRGTPIDDYMRVTLAPLLLVLGCIDVCFDHPQAPPGEKIVTRADELRLGLDRCVVSYVLPQNMVWWRNDTAGRYIECLVREYVDPSARTDHDEHGNPVDPDAPDERGEAWRRSYVRFRLWTPEESVLFSSDGTEVIERARHSFGRVPIVRLVDLPRHRAPHIGMSRYNAVAEYQREYYNRDSELILSDTLQAHPFLSGAEDFCKSDNTVSVGPGYILPMKKNPETGTYQGWEFVSPPKDPAESLRKNKADILELKDRRACLMKPAGSTHAGHSTVSQSGISKQLDAMTGHKLLTSISKSLAKAERALAEYACLVLRDAPIDRAVREQIRVAYPARFDLFAAGDMIDNLVKLQGALAHAGAAPNTEREILQTIVRQTLLGLTDQDYERLDAEIERLVETRSRLNEPIAEMANPGITSFAEAMQGSGSPEQAAGLGPPEALAESMADGLVPPFL